MDHKLLLTPTGWTCTICEWRWKRKPTSRCPGIRQYPWSGPERPEYLLTKAQLRKKGLNPGGPPVGAIYHMARRCHYDLYDERQATPRKATPAQLAALAKARAAALTARTCKGCGSVESTQRELGSRSYEDGWCDWCRLGEDERRGRNWAIRAARELVELENLVVLDTETTGLYSDEEDGQEIIELAVVGRAGETLFLSRFRPTRGITPEATEVNRLTLDDLVDAPDFASAWPRIEALLRGKVIAIFNADFDLRMLASTMRRYQLGSKALFEGFEENSRCLMEMATSFLGQRRWVSLAGACHDLRIERPKHTAQDDAMAALRLLQRVAAAELSEERIPLKVRAEVVSDPSDDFGPEEIPF